MYVPTRSRDKVKDKDPAEEGVTTTKEASGAQSLQETRRQVTRMTIAGSMKQSKNWKALLRQDTGMAATDDNEYMLCSVLRELKEQGIISYKGDLDDWGIKWC